MHGQEHFRAGLEQFKGFGANVQRHVAGGEAVFGGGLDAVHINLHVLIVSRIELQIGEMARRQGDFAAQPDIVGVPLRVPDSAGGPDGGEAGQALRP